MNAPLPLQAAAVLVLGVLAQWLAARLRLPSILLLLVTGFLAGPVSGLLAPDALLPGDLLSTVVSLSVAIILFEGGLTLRLAEGREVGGVVGRLVTVGVLVTWILGALTCWALGMQGPIAVLLGAILVLSGPTVVGPMLQHLRLEHRVGAALKWEGIVIDPVGALLAALVYQAVLSGTWSESVGAAGIDVVQAVLVGGAAGGAGFLLVLVALRRHALPDRLQAPFTLGLVVAISSAANLVQHESGLIAVTLMGYLLANQRRLVIRRITAFKEHLTVLLISSLFILLAARIPLETLGRNLFPHGAVLLGVLLLVRPLSVLVSTIGSDLDVRERLFLGCMFPRGIVAAAVAPLFALDLAQRFDDASRLVPLTYIVIVGTVLVYGLAAPVLARRLGVSHASPQGVLLVGADHFARELAAVLKAQGVDVALVDTNRRDVAAARLAGLTAYYENVMAEGVLEELDLGPLRTLLCATPSDDVNSLTALHGEEKFGRAGVFQLAPEPAGGPAGEAREPHLLGRIAFSREATHSYLARRLAQGAVVKRTRLGDDFDLDAFYALYGASALVLAVIDPEKQVNLVEAGDKPSDAAGSTLVSLVDPVPERSDDAHAATTQPSGPGSEREGESETRSEAGARDPHAAATAAAEKAE